MPAFRHDAASLPTDKAAAIPYPDAYLEDLLHRVGTVALIGASPKPDRPSHEVMAFLLDAGYRVFPVNPGQAGKTILGQPVHATLADIPGSFDMVDIFRKSEAAGETVDDAIALATTKGISAVWMQLGVRDDDAARRAEAAGLAVVMNRCPKIEVRRLMASGKKLSPAR